jgi:hypothetical protein
MQERLKEAQTQFDKIREFNQSMYPDARLQYDYIKAYFEFTSA